MWLELTLSVPKVWMELGKRIPTIIFIRNIGTILPDRTVSKQDHKNRIQVTITILYLPVRDLNS